MTDAQNISLKAITTVAACGVALVFATAAATAAKGATVSGRTLLRSHKHGLAATLRRTYTGSTRAINRRATLHARRSK